MDLKLVSLIVAALVVLSHTVQGQVLLPGRCDRQQAAAMSDFDVSQYVGKWYEQYRYFAAFEIGLKCVTAEYSPLPDGTVQVNNKGINSNNGEAKDILGIASIQNPEEPGKLHVVFPEQGAEAELWILRTDYENFSVAYSCRDAPGLNLRFVSAWLLSRTAEGYTADVRAEVDRILLQNNVDVRRFLPVDQQSCPAATLDFLQ
ncbi:ApoD2 [Ramazzottius varieornatus]|uniref:Apolipoprotein D n=1 Tax=Ramazzottius varieornatus TaxID=947166 RepID=A0A1D1URQ2_RAMVA|nr:ApoD2 [Ramazzottius varieornatus]